MTGHNHPPNCTCGWCVYSDRDSGNQHRLSLSEARLLLKTHGVTSRLSCFVNPNARCPVCQASVYYYANDVGSRVFFDQLGPPWPKHPCTDIPGIRMPGGSTLKLRNLMLTDRLLISVQLVRGIAGTSYRPTLRDWKILQVVQRTLNGLHGAIITQHINPKEGGQVPFNYTSSSTNFEIGDLLYFNGEEVEYIDKRTLKPQKFYAPLTEIKLIKSSGSLHQSNVRVIRPEVPIYPRAHFQYDLMTGLAASHFPNSPKLLEAFLERFGRIIYNYRSSGTKGQSMIAKMLNRDGYRTYRGDLWTKSLVGNLLNLLSPGKNAGSR